MQRGLFNRAPATYLPRDREPRNIPQKPEPGRLSLGSALACHRAVGGKNGPPEGFTAQQRQDFCDSWAEAWRLGFRNGLIRWGQFVGDEDEFVKAMRDAFCFSEAKR